MSALLRGLARLGSFPALRRTAITQRANLTSKPAKYAVGPAETTIGFSMFALAILVPSGWVLSNLENYKKKNV